jgi:hypothetical protein
LGILTRGFLFSPRLVRQAQYFSIIVVFSLFMRFYLVYILWGYAPSPQLRCLAGWPGAFAPPATPVCTPRPRKGASPLDPIMNRAIARFNEKFGRAFQSPRTLSFVLDFQIKRQEILAV